MNGKTVSHTCQHCKGEFFAPLWRHARYCCNRCYLDAKTAKLADKSRRICKHCSREFSAPPWLIRIGKGRFCSAGCFQSGKDVKSIKVRFQEYVGEKDDNGCMRWLGSIGNHGYGLLTQSRPSKKYFLAHRLAYKFAFGKLDASLFVLHRCDNRACVNPDHLVLGTQQDNMDDKVRKGRQTKGAANGGAKLTDSKVREIRRRRARGETLKSIAARFSVNPKTVIQIVRFVAWKHVK